MQNITKSFMNAKKLMNETSKNQDSNDKN